MGYDRGDTFPFDFEQMDFHLVHKRKENCHHDHIPFNLDGNIVFSVYLVSLLISQKEKNLNSGAQVKFKS